MARVVIMIWQNNLWFRWNSHDKVKPAREAIQASHFQWRIVLSICRCENGTKIAYFRGFKIQNLDCLFQKFLLQIAKATLLVFNPCLMQSLAWRAEPAQIRCSTASKTSHKPPLIVFIVFQHRTPSIHVLYLTNTQGPFNTQIDYATSSVVNS